VPWISTKAVGASYAHTSATAAAWSCAVPSASAGKSSSRVQPSSRCATKFARLHSPAKVEMTPSHAAAAREAEAARRARERA